MSDRLSVRQWQEQFLDGAFDKPDCSVQMDAGWYTWVCSTDSLPGRLKKLAKLVMGVTDPYILDNYYILCANFSSRFNKQCDAVGFVPFLEENQLKSIDVTLDDPRHRKKWSLFTWRYGLDGPEYDHANVRQMIRYINKIGPELERDITPPFVGERRAVEVYAHKRHGEPWEIPVYRNGEHCFTYKSRQDGKEHVVMVTSDLTAPPPGFLPEQSVPVTDIYIHCPEHMKGLYVFCPEDAGIPPPALQRAVGKAPNRKKEVQR